MLINLAKLKNLRVETMSGDFLGTILDVEIDVATGMVAKYIVGYDFFVMKQPIYAIAPIQVTKVSEILMTVEDSVEKIKKEKTEEPKIIKEEAPTLNMDLE